MASFLEGRIGFTSISRLTASTMDAHTPAPAETLAEVRRVDTWARTRASELVLGFELELKPKG